MQRLANDAAALPQINMRVTGMGVTQGIQNLSNGVLLVKNRRTFVRAYPIGSSVGQNFKPRLWNVDGAAKLGSWVNRSSGDCTKEKIGANVFGPVR